MVYRPPFPDEADVLQGWLEQHSTEIRTAMPGRITRYDAALQVADVQPLIRLPVPQADGTVVQEDQPLVPSVPVVFPRSGQFGITFPLAPGDTVLLVCCEGAIGPWRAGTDTVSDPGDERRHHLSHAVAIPGLYTSAKALTNPAPASGTEMRVGHQGNGSRIALDADGSLRVHNLGSVVLEVTAGGEIRLGAGAAQYVAMAPLVDALVTSLKTAIAAIPPTPVWDGYVALKAALVNWNPSSTAAASVKAI